MNPLDALRDIHTPPPVDWWPPAPGWWLLFTLLIAAVVAFIYWRKRRPIKKHSHNYRQAAIKELQQIEQNWQSPDNDAECIQALTLLMKRYVNTYQPQASSLTGKAWLDFLDQTGGAGRFQQFHYQLCVAPYCQAAIQQKEELLALVRTWVGRN
jgi:cbb3-type cytochrome oxidase subunit 3